MAEINITCGNCRSCLAGRPHHCEKRTVLGIKDRNGAFAEYICLPLQNLIAVPDELPDDTAVFMEPLAAALEIQEQIKIKATDRMLVLGAGRLGQLIAQTLAATGCHLNVVARYRRQQRLLANRKIAWITESEVSPHAFDIVVEATGNPSGFTLAQIAVRPRGTIICKSTYQQPLPIDFAPIVVDEITLIGSRCGPFGPALRMMRQGLVDPAALIDGRFPLEQAAEAFERAAAPGALKVILQIAK